MRYIIIILLGLTLPTIAIGASMSNDINNREKIVQQQNKTIKKLEEKIKKLEQKIQKSAPRGCNPKEELHMLPFN